MTMPHPLELKIVACYSNIILNTNSQNHDHKIMPALLGRAYIAATSCDGNIKFAHHSVITRMWSSFLKGHRNEFTVQTC